MEHPENIKYPTLTVGGKIYELRLNSGAFIRMADDFGMTLKDALDKWQAPTTSGNDRIKLTLTIIYAMIGHRTGLSFAQFCDEIPVNELTPAVKSIQEALLKAAAQLEAAKAAEQIPEAIQ